MISNFLSDVIIISDRLLSFPVIRVVSYLVFVFALIGVFSIIFEKIYQRFTHDR